MKKRISITSLVFFMVFTLINASTKNVNAASYIIEDNFWFLERNGTMALDYYTGDDDVVRIPSQVNGKEVTIIDDGAFSAKEMTSVIMPNSIKEIGMSAFGGCCNLTSITIPNGVTTIKSNAFSGCYNLTSINIPNSVTTIEYGTFAHCSSLKEIRLPNNITEIPSSLFQDCGSLSNITIPDKVTIIYDYAFKDCSNLKSIKIPNSVTAIRNGVFQDCESLTSVKLPNNLSLLGNSAFSGCSNLTSITIPNGVKTIAEDTFLSCIKLKDVTISNSVKTISDNAFLGCDSLTSFTVNSGNTVYASKDGVLFNKNLTKLIMYPAGNTRKKYSIPNGVKIIGFEAFYCCNNLTDVTIPNSVTTIDDFAFVQCEKLKNMNITSSVSKIGYASFLGCDKLVLNILNNDYAVKYAKNNGVKYAISYKITYKLNGGTNNKSNPSTYTSKVTLKNPTRKGYVFKGWYSDSKFKSKVTNISSGNKTLYAKWSKVSVAKAKTPTLTNVKGSKLKISYKATSGAKGYQIQYATNKKFTSGKKSKTLTAKSTTLKLTKKKTYYVRVRAYKIDSTGAKVYGSWSAVKSKKITK